MVEVYRIQDSEGRGPWRPGFSHNWVESRSDHANLVPWFTEFGMGIFKGMKSYEHGGSACLDLDQLKRWFTESEYLTLLEFGYKCVKMDAHRILAKSEIQCVFFRRKPLYMDCQTIELYPPQDPQ
jgi:hypothetical protein